MNFKKQWSAASIIVFATRKYRLSLQLLFFCGSDIQNKGVKESKAKQVYGLGATITIISARKGIRIS